MNKEQKHTFVEQWREEIRDIPHAVLVDYRGLTVAEATDLRTRIREAGSTYKVVKNNLAKLAIPGSQLEGLMQYFVGPCAVAYNSQDPVILAKTLAEFSKDHPSLEIKAAVIDGKVLEAGQVKELARLPSRDELLSKLLYLLNYPVQGLASALNNIVRNLAVVLAQVALKKEQ